MYNAEIKPSCQKDVEKLCRNNPILKQALDRKMNEIIENPKTLQAVKI